MLATLLFLVSAYADEPVSPADVAVTPADVAVSPADVAVPPTYAVHPDPRWGEVYRRSRGTVQVGTVSCVVGPAVGGVGFVVLLVGALGQDVPVADAGALMFLGGGIAAEAGPAMIAGGSLRGRRAVLEQGVDVTGAPGAVAWGLWGAQLATWTLAPQFAKNTGGPAGFSALALTLYGGSVAAGLVQWHLDRGATDYYGLAQADDAPRLEVAVVPWADGDGRGVAFAARF